ncbi:RNA polymerase sigma factor [Cohnella sp. REN36]|uniref:RNA polymerase sigma factor n=1 Tax=Cohnella sp. REN36 TaxID=2887347 RepID=UPI001D13D3CE|nr:sigma-70 family RNA polymerase sigma factor [Cohnella sp. REN36]MCC3377082.1 sigma-70 family RNA polymerase sigma factor [Cohnella sp. REN36]
MTNSLRDSENPGYPAIEEELLTEMYRQMLRVARHRLHQKNDAVDIVQEAWVRILEKMDTLRESNKIIPWAKTIAANLASNANRARRAETVCESCDEYASGLYTMPEPEIFAELSDVLGRLDPQTRTLLLYKFYYGFKDNEIAAALDVPVGTVKARIHRGKARIKAQSQEDSSRT